MMRAMLRMPAMKRMRAMKKNASDPTRKTQECQKSLYDYSRRKSTTREVN